MIAKRPVMFKCMMRRSVCVFTLIPGMILFRYRILSTPKSKKSENKFMKHQKANKNNELKPLFFRCPSDLLAEIEAQSVAREQSKAAVVVDLLRQGLGQEPANQGSVSDWISRNA